MSKPIMDVYLTTAEEKTATAKAVFDTGSFYTILRGDLLPDGTAVIRYKTPLEFKTAGEGEGHRGRSSISSVTSLLSRSGEG